MADNDPVLSSIYGWTAWFNCFLARAMHAGIHPNIRPHDTVPWRAVPAPGSCSAEWAVYQREQAAQATVRRWILDHVSPYLAALLGQLPTDDPCAFLTALQERLDVSPARLQLDLAAQYRDAMDRLEHRPAPAGNAAAADAQWIDDWEVAMVQCRDGQLPQALDGQRWWRDVVLHARRSIPYPIFLTLPMGLERVLAGTFALEDAADEMRTWLRLTPVQVRHKRLCPTDAQGHTTALVQWAIKMEQKHLAEYNKLHRERAECLPWKAPEAQDSDADMTEIYNNIDATVEEMETLVFPPIPPMYEA